MSAIIDTSKKLIGKLQNRAYRHTYLAEHVRRGIAYQIRALRDQRKWNQGEFSKQLGKPQSVVSRLEDPSYGKVTIQTLLEIADVFDVALQVKFATYSTFLRQTRDVSTRSMQVAPFDEDLEIQSSEVSLKEFSVVMSWPTSIDTGKDISVRPGSNQSPEAAAYA